MSSFATSLWLLNFLVIGVGMGFHAIAMTAAVNRLGTAMMDVAAAIREHGIRTAPYVPR